MAYLIMPMVVGRLIYSLDWHAAFAAVRWVRRGEMSAADDGHGRRHSTAGPCRTALQKQEGKQQRAVHGPQQQQDGWCLTLRDSSTCTTAEGDAYYCSTCRPHTAPSNPRAAPI